MVPRRTMLAVFVGVLASTPASAAPAKRAAPTPLTAAEKAVAVKYAAAMKRGRVATDKKDYVAAVAAFDGALALRKDDAQALAERGFAHLLAKDVDAAERDLHAAQPHAAGASLAGMIWFNLGLVAEQRHDAAAAARAFGESNRLHPTHAAADKLAGATCSATLVTARNAGTTYRSWVALATALETAMIGMDAPADARPALPKSEADAKARLCDGGCDGHGPWIVAAKDTVGDESYTLVLQVGAALVAHAGLGQKLAGRCETSDAVELGSDRSLVHVSVVSEPNDLVDVDTSGGGVTPCGDHSDHCGEACFYDDKTDLDYYFDPATGAQLLAATRPESPRAGVELKLDEDFTQHVKLARTADGVTLAGAGCDLRAPLP